MPSKTRILYVHSSNELYGSDRVLLRLATHLNRQKYAPYVCLPDDMPYAGLLAEELRKVEIPYKKLKLGVLRRRYYSLSGIGLFGYRTVKTAFTLAAMVRRGNIDLIHTNSLAVVAGGLAAKLAGVPHIWHVHEIIVRPTWLNKLMTYNLKQLADCVVAVSTPAKENLLKAQPSLTDKIKVVRNGIDVARFGSIDRLAVKSVKRAWRIPENAVVIGMVGRINAWKGQRFLLNAVEGILRAHANVYLAMVGGCVPGEDWRREELRQLIGERHLHGRVRLVGFQPNIPNVMAAFDVFVLPSINPDPFPTVVLEAMAAAKPVVATAHGGVLEQVQEGVTGFLVSPHVPEEMAQALTRLIFDPQLGKKMGAAGRRRVTACFSRQRYIYDIELLYQNVLDGRYGCQFKQRWL